MENLNYLDAALGGIVVISALIGLARGFVKEVLSLVAWIAAVYIAWLFAERVAHDYIRQFIDDELISYLTAFGLLFLGVLFVIGLFNLIVTQLLSITGLGGFNRLLGMFFGFARGVVIGILMMFVLNLTPLTKEVWWHQSTLRPYFANVGEWAWSKLPDNIRSLLKQGGDSVAEVVPHLIRTDTRSNNHEIIDTSRMAARPETRVSKDQRNAISDMSQPELRLESTPDDTQDNRLNIQLESTQ